MKRLNFTFDQSTINLLEELSNGHFQGNKSQTVREALECLKLHIGREGWVIRGYTPQKLDEDLECHKCGEEHHPGEVLYKPVFEKGSGPLVITELPKKNWVECDHCVGS